MIRIHDLSLTKSGKKIFKDVSLHIPSGEKHLISGKSGSGKSSLFRLMLGFEQPDAGRIDINGMELSPETIHSIRGLVFYLSQDVELPHLTGEQLIAETLKYNKRSPMAKKDLVFFLEILSLPMTLLQQNTDDLSGGERQRLGLLLCFLLNRPIWLLDEPTSALDKQAKYQISEYIAGTEKTVLIISHDQAWFDLPGIIMTEWR